MTQITKFAFTYLLLFVTVLAVAQTPQKVGGGVLKVLNEKLELSDTQYNQVKGFVMEQRDKIQAIRADDSIESADKLNALKEVRSNFEGNMKSVLNEGQFAEFKALKNELSARNRGSMKKTPDKRRPSYDEAKKKRAEMKALRMEVEPKVRAIRADFEKQIKRKDRKEIEKLRVAFEAKQAERKADRQKMKDADQRPNRDELRKKAEMRKEEMPAEKEAIAKLAEKYSDAIQATFDANPEVKEYFSARHKAQGRKGKGQGKGDGMKKGKGKEGMSKDKMGKKHKAAGLFLLMNPEK